MILILFLALLAGSALNAQETDPEAPILNAKETAPKVPKPTPEQQYLLFNDHSCAGMFAVFSAVEAYLYCYEKMGFAGFYVDFANRGFYYETAHGPNWWEYYCAPIRLGSRPLESSPLLCEHQTACSLHGYAHDNQKLHEVHRIVQKYIKIKPAIRRKVQSFYNKHMKGHTVIGLHYRGTDKGEEVPRATYAHVIEVVRNYIQENKFKDYRIFVATDEQRFLNHMQSLFPSKVLFIPAFRSLGREPVHMKASEPYKRGEEAILDCLLLSKTDILFRCVSHLSLWSSYFNPQLKVVMLNDGFEFHYPEK
jgi:hypothetical protein